ncbi:iron-containing redox enzyme family protein [Salinarimonas sp. NSM]|uniref:iron-containing redox enzyme family protein n=1 Tax=Salinarimonas sp. NSM TaxID=3458003 RepID=UPI004036DB33
MGVLSVAQVDGILSGRMAAQMLAVRSSSTTADAFATDPRRLSAWVLARHSAEHVIRIRQFRQLDSEATRMIAQADPRAAEIWAGYARSEAVHDRYYLRDLEGMGIGREAVDALEPLAATRALVAYVRGAMALHGPLPVVLYSFWAEKCSDLGSTPVIETVRARFGDAAVRGASKHRALDENLDHAEVVAEVLATLVGDTRRLFAADAILAGISRLVADYFAELEALDHLWHARTPAGGDPAGGAIRR